MLKYICREINVDLELAKEAILGREGPDCDDSFKQLAETTENQGAVI